MTELQASQTRHHAAAFAFFILASLVLNWPHFTPYLADINFDLFIHYNWAREFRDSLASGVLYPRWTFNGNFGLGEPAFVFYSPLYYFSSAALSLATHLTTWQAMQVVEVVSNAIFAWFIYRTCSYYTSTRVALLTGLAALFSPFLVMLHFKFHGFAWSSVAYATHGFLLWALMRPKADTLTLNTAAALAIGLAVWSHTISALVNLICFSAVVFARRNALEPYATAFGKNVLGWAVTSGLGLGLSAAYLLPALYSTRFINTSAWTGDHILQAFAWPTFTMWIHGVQWFSFQWPIALPALLLLAAVALYLRRNSGDLKLPALFKLLAVGLTGFFFASELSYPLWRYDWALTRIQLPYRFLSVIYAVGTVASGILLAKAMARGQRPWTWVFSGLLALTIGLGAAAAYKATYIDGARLSKEVQEGDYSFRPFEKAFRESPTKGDCKEGDTACRAVALAAGSFRGVGEYRTMWRGPEAMQFSRGGFEEECAALGSPCKLVAATGNLRSWQISVKSDQSVRLPVYHFPGWQVRVDGQPVAHTIDARTGVIEVPLKAGSHEVMVHWVATPTEVAGWYITAASAFVLVLLGWLQARRLRASSGALRAPAAR